MNPAFQHLALAALRPGMRLSDQLLDAQGQVLLPKGAVLTARTLSQLAAHGIEMVPVESQPDGVGVDSAAAMARIDYLFRRNDPDNADDWATGLLRRYLLDYRLQREIEQ
ncbi:MAG: hypothetical protein ACLGI6_13545 [Gammaproteobacteria bacterium]